MSDPALPLGLAPDEGPGPGVTRSGPVALATMVGRCVRLSRRTVDALITALMLPVMIMLMFVYLFGGAISTGTAYVTYVVPGVLLLCACFGSATTAVTVSQDLTGGIVDRFRSMDLGGATILTGHVTASVLRNAASTTIVFGVAFAIGFRPHADLLHWLAGLGVLVLFVAALSWASAMVGLVANSPEAANGFSFFLMFISYPSSAFVPIDTMPTWMQGFARNQPVTHVVESLRGLLLDRPVGSHVWAAVAWSAGITVMSVVASAVLFRRRTV
jgi:ABC-2 type transport system permease protein